MLEGEKKTRGREGLQECVCWGQGVGKSKNKENQVYEAIAAPVMWHVTSIVIVNTIDKTCGSEAYPNKVGSSL